MFRPDGLREPCIVGAQFRFQGLSADGVAGFDSLEPCMLRAIQLEIAMEQVVQLILDRGRRHDIEPADHDPRYCRNKRQQHEKEKAAAIAHHCALSSVEGASASRASKGDAAASAERTGTAEPAMPMKSATAAATPKVVALRRGMAWSRAISAMTRLSSPASRGSRGASRNRLSMSSRWSMMFLRLLFSIRRVVF